MLQGNDNLPLNLFPSRILMRCMQYKKKEYNYTVQTITVITII